MRKVKRVCRKLGIPQDKKILSLVGIAIVVLLVSSQPVIAKISDLNFGWLSGFWNGRFTFSVPYEKQEGIRVTRQGVFEGKAVWNQSTGCWEITGKTKESYNSYGDSGVREVETRRDCSINITVK